MSRQVTLSHSIYPFQCIVKAIEAYGAVCNIQLGTANGDKSSLLIEAIYGEEELTHEFLNYVLDVSLEWHLRDCE